MPRVVITLSHPILLLFSPSYLLYYLNWLFLFFYILIGLLSLDPRYALYYLI